MRKSRTPTPVITAVLTLITIFFWTGFEVFRSFTQKPPPEISESIIKPLDPSLDIESLNDISSRPFLSDTEIGNNVLASPSATPTVEPTVTTVSTSPTAQPTLEPSPTP